MSVQEKVVTLVTPIVEAIDVDLYDVDYNGGILRVMVDREGGVDIGVIQDLSRRISFELDEQEVIGARYTLEVSSPGLERKLRTAQHFQGAIGAKVTVKLMPGSEGPRRRDGVLAAADESSITLRTEEGGTVDIATASISGARTVFDWGPSAKADKKVPSRSSLSEIADDGEATS
ncbi:MAG: ribosome maturation factor RimP [Acidobacteria bacterium]|nr:ribosome maturation factor RimP [Acidobacteriota bacterium]